MKKIEYLSIFLCVLYLMGAAYFVQAADKEGIEYADSFFYIITDEGEAVIVGSDIGGTISIPGEIDGISISGIGEGAFQGRTDIKKVVVEQGVRYIAEDAFAGCTEIEKLELGEDLLYIGEGAFFGNIKINELILPDSMAYVGKNAFADCTKLETISLPRWGYVDAYAFEGSAWQEKRDEEGLVIRGSCFLGVRYDKSSTLEIPYGITRTAAFKERIYALISQDIRYEEIVLPETLIELGAYCFQETQIQKIHLPEGLKTINEGVFAKAVLGEIILSPKLERIEFGAFWESSIIEINLPGTLEVIEPYAFWGSEGLKKIMIPASVYYIGEGAFCGCRSMEEIVFEEGLVVVDSWAFSAVSVERIQFPESLESICGSGPRSEQLNRIYIPESTRNIDESFWSFKEYNSTIVVYGQSESLAEKEAKENYIGFVAVASGNEMP
ncbi:MAG: leucine-rich repeat domain-containing protein [Lachnospiraceae bacterium]|nr:leucine-rich repeat domain-containing protein [Lachnospiraceae bacterium]